MGPPSFGSARSLVVYIVLLARLASSQAPDDAEERCTSRSDHPSYEAHIRRLLDTRDYSKLLPYESDGTGGVWQTLDLDGDGTQWRTSSQILCAETTDVCGRNRGSQNNWMITQPISVPAHVTSVVVEMDSMLEPMSTCSPSASSCVEDLKLYVWETSTRSEVSAAETDNYRYVADISSGEGVKVEVSLEGESGMMYLGIRDNGTCVVVSRLLVYYRVCEGGSEGLVTVEENSDGNHIVEGKCVENSVSITQSPPLLECQVSGQWKTLSGCKCSEQYYLHPSQQQCLRSPSAPVGLEVLNLTNQTLLLSWSPPPPTDGSNSSNQIYYTASYEGQSTSVMDGVTKLKVTGLTPFSQYNFSVTSENSVSSQDTNITARTRSISAKTLEGVAGKVVDIKIGEGEEFITWSEPNPPLGRILQYNIRIIESRTQSRLFSEHNSTRISWNTWKNIWLVSSDKVRIQIQAETSVGSGEFSDEIYVFPPTTGGISVPDSEGLSAQLFVVVILVPVVFLLLILVTLVVIILIVWRRRSMRSKMPQSATPIVNKSNDVIEEYASVKLSPSDAATFTVASQAPPLPRSPRPQKPSQSCSTNSDANNGCSNGEDPTYHVLEGPPGHAFATNAYSLDPVEPVFADQEIDYGGGENPANLESGAARGQERVYFELEPPQSSAVIKQRVNKAPVLAPTYESVKDSWSQRRGPDQPNMNLLLSSRVRHQDSSSQPPLEGGPTPPTSGGGPPSLELAATSSAE